MDGIDLCLNEAPLEEIDHVSSLSTAGEII